MRALPLFSSFSSGEITPLLITRADTDAYKNGCSLLQNMIATSHGPVMRRKGTSLLGWDEVIAAEGPVVDARIMDFSVTKTLGTYVLVLLYEDGSTKVKPYSPSGKVVDPAVELVKNSFFDSGADDWTDVSLGTGAIAFANGQVTLTAGPSGQIDTYVGNYVFNIASPPDSGELFSDATTLHVHKTDDDGTDRSLELIDLKADDTFMVVESGDASRFSNYIVTAPAIDAGTYINIPVALEAAGGGLRNARDVDATWNVSQTGTQAAGIEQQVTGTVNGNDLTLEIYTAIDAGNATTIVQVGTTQGGNDLYEASYIGGLHEATFTNTGGTSVWLTIYTPTDTPVKIIDAVSMYDSTLTQPQDVEVIFDAPWTADELKSLQYDTPPEGNILYITSPQRVAHKLTYDIATSGWTFEAVAFTSQPAEWVAGSFPRAITFYQGRMWLGGTANNPETFWASKSGSIENFDQGGETSLPDDGLEFTMSEHGEIEWMAGAKNLVIGTANGEHIVESAEGVIVPSDIQVTQQSAYGSRQVQSEKIGQDILYISPDGRKIREISYKWTDDGWISRDITFASEHITRENTIKRFCFAQNPSNLIWAVTDQGDLLGCTFEKTYSVIGWHHHTTKGTYIDVAAVDINGTSVMGCVVKRAVNGIERLFIEVLDEDNRFYMDSYLYKDFISQVTEATGFEHLAGQTVDVMTDSGVHPPVTVSDTGVITLQWLAREVVAGHNMTAMMSTLSPDMVGSEGASYAQLKSWAKLYVRVFESGNPLINGERAPERYPATLMNTPEMPDKTKDIEVSSLGYANWSPVDISQDLPIPLTVLGIFGTQQRDTL